MIRRSIQNTLARLFGRLNVMVRVGVAQSSDPDQVRAALTAAAARCPDALKEPAPDIAFVDIGDNALVFSVTVAIRDLAKAPRVATALRTQVVKALREWDIAIAKPQVDVHLRDLDGVRAFLIRLAQERTRQQQEEQVASNDGSKPKDEEG
jgi:small-conductance mechanosensitive channel